VLLSVLVSSCAQEELPLSVWNERHPPGEPIPTRDGGAPTVIGTCRVPSAEAMPATVAATTGAPATSDAGKGTTLQIFAGIDATCNGSGCHNTSANGFFVMGPADLLQPGGENFATQGEWAIAHIEGDFTMNQVLSKAPCTFGSPSTCETMPPYTDPTYGGKTWSQRSSSDPIVKLDGLLRAWFASGKLGTFLITSPDAGASPDAGSTNDVSSYAMPTEVGAAMTNLGSCVPDPSLTQIDTSTMDTLDAAFAAMLRAPVGDPDQGKVIGLPPMLSMTDLTTFDSEVLARSGVIAYVPQYPLWADDAAMLRFVRVPRGQSIEFDKTAQEFVIPENSRFYETFAKRIIDSDGNVSYRKIETRLIVSRREPAWDQVSQPASLYGTYRWTKDEKEAYLEPVSDPTLFDSLQPTGALHDGTGFIDDMFTYDVDYPAIAELTAAWGGNIDSLNAKLLASRLRRTYAMPSSTRCIQCHIGSPSKSFILGFRPVQVVHRPVGQGGVIEPSGSDEMTQLQRLVDYGVITGIDSPTDVLPLENSQTPRAPRNEYELIAQGYLLGNCSHCHNPNGYASVTFPQLKDVLSFLPQAGPFGGVFQFPLQKVSPRIVRGQVGSIELPYITPSLQDYPSYPSTDESPLYGDTTVGYSERAFLPKWQENGDYYGFIYAPWRSLIYRNTDTPLSYADDFTIYPHMPMNSPGFDCRAKQILGDWMVSIPAVRKHPELPEYAWPFDATSEGIGSGVNPLYQPPLSVADMSFQPYVEVTPGDPAYPQAIVDAEGRLAIFHSGHRPGGSGTGPTGPDQQWFGSRFYACSDTSDTVDPTVTGCITYPTEKESPTINVPTHPNWVALDLTQSTTDWSIDEESWPAYLVMHSPVPQQPDSCTAQGALNDANHQRQVVADLLAGVSAIDGGVAGAVSPDAGEAPSPVSLADGVSWDSTISSARALFEQQLPVGLWQEKPECDWSKVPQVTTVGEERAKQPHMAWLDQPGLDETRHVYKETMGAVVFNEVCINCHGQNADSRGRLADNLANITGGQTIVADFKDGLFGPASNPGANKRAEWGDLDTTPPDAPDGGDSAAWQSMWARSWRTPLGNILMDGGATPLEQWVDDWAARYMGYMALGGTTAIINPSFLGIVAHTPFLGAARTGLEIGTSEGANMLAVGRELCGGLLTTNNAILFNGTVKPFLTGHFDKESVHQEFLFDNADAQIWLELCTLNNPPPIIAYTLSSGRFSPVLFQRGGAAVLLRDPFVNWSLGGFVVGDETGTSQTALTTTNLRPWCLANMPPGPSPLPMCPVPFDTDEARADPNWVPISGDVMTRWKLRGAINAGLAVFVYLDDLTRSQRPAQPTFDQCEKLISSAAAADAGQ
jgi:mono/diheme cytochrome c family protein